MKDAEVKARCEMKKEAEGQKSAASAEKEKLAHEKMMAKNAAAA